jgi:hypothetical protein
VHDRDFEGLDGADGRDGVLDQQRAVPIDRTPASWAGW